MARLADVTAQIDAKLTSVTGLRTKLGNEFVAENDRPPRIVYVPTEDSFTGARHHNMKYKTRQTLLAGFEVHCWAAAEADDASDAKHIRATEALRDEFIFRAHEALPGVIEFTGGEWVPANKSMKGRVYVLRARVATPIIPLEGDTTLVTITGIPAAVLSTEDIEGETDLTTEAES